MMLGFLLARAGVDVVVLDNIWLRSDRHSADVRDDDVAEEAVLAHAAPPGTSARAGLLRPRSADHVLN